MKLDWLTVDGENISWDNGMLDASPDFFKNVEFLVDAKVRVRSPRFYFAEEVAGMETMMGALLTVEFLLDVLNIGLLEAPMPFGESDVFVTDNHDVFNKVREFEKAMSRSEAGKYAAEQRWKNHAKKQTVKQETLLTPTDDAEVARTTGRPLSWALPATRDPKLTEILGRLVGDFSMSPPRYHEYDRIVRDPATKELLKYLESKGIVGKSDFDAGKTNAGIMAVGLLQNGLESSHSWAFAEPPKGFAPYAKARMIVEEGSPVINVTAYALTQIISSGRYKTQFETQESNGALNPYIRAAFESGTMGLHPNMDATKRPVYGTMQTFESIVNTHPMSQYGTISLQLNENVRERSTVSYNDSLGMARDTAPAESTGKELDRMFNTGSSGAHFDYVEAQIHGGVSFSDVKAIWVNEKYAPDDFKNVTAILFKYGLSHIPVMRVGVDDFYKAMSRSEAGKYAAEQRWKNHAKKEDVVRVLDPQYQKVADRINAGLQSLTEAGFQIENIESDEDHARVRDMYVKFRDFFEQQSELWRETKGEQGKQFPSRTYQGLNMIKKAMVMSGKTSSFNRVIVAHDNGVIAGAAHATIAKRSASGRKTMTINYMGSSQVVKGVGSAMYGDLLKWGASQGVEEFELVPLDEAQSFWQGEMGMIWTGGEMVYADSKIGMIGALK